MTDNSSSSSSTQPNEDGDKWYYHFLEEVGPRTMLLSGTIAADRALVDGDSLLMDLVPYTPLRFFDHGEGEKEGGSGCFLQLVYLVEKRLHELLERGVHVRVYFCSDFERLLRPTTTATTVALRLARRAILTHLLTQARELLDVDLLPQGSFPGSPPWNEYIKEHNPVCVLLHSGLGLQSRMAGLAKATAEPASATLHRIERYFQYQVFWTSSIKYAVALVNDLTVLPTDISADVLRPIKKLSQTEHVKTYAENFQRELPGLPSMTEDTSSLDPSAITNEMQLYWESHSLQTTLQSQGLLFADVKSQHFVGNVASCAVLLRRYCLDRASHDEDARKYRAVIGLFFVHGMMLPSLPLKLRLIDRRALPSFPAGSAGGELRKWMDSVYASVALDYQSNLLFLALPTVADLSRDRGSANTLVRPVDVFDGVFLRALMSLYCANVDLLDLPQEWKDWITYCWSAVVDAANAKDLDRDSPLPPFSKLFGASSGEGGVFPNAQYQKASLESMKASLLAQTPSFEPFNELSENWKEFLTRNGLAQLRLVDNPVTSSEFLTRHPWQSNVEIESRVMYYFEKKDKNSARANQLFGRFMLEYGRSEKLLTFVATATVSSKLDKKDAKKGEKAKSGGGSDESDQSDDDEDNQSKANDGGKKNESRNKYKGAGSKLETKKMNKADLIREQNTARKNDKMIAKVEGTLSKVEGILDVSTFKSWTLADVESKLWPLLESQRLRAVNLEEKLSSSSTLTPEIWEKYISMPMDVYRIVWDIAKSDERQRLNITTEVINVSHIALLFLLMNGYARKDPLHWSPDISDEEKKPLLAIVKSVTGTLKKIGFVEDAAWIAACLPKEPSSQSRTETGLERPRSSRLISFQLEHMGNDLLQRYIFRDDRISSSSSSSAAAEKEAASSSSQGKEGKGNPKKQNSKDKQSPNPKGKQQQIQRKMPKGEPLMEPEIKSDPRTSGFKPDGWQVKVLDAVDADKSMVVCAPTSSGKTFISFYCMQHVISKNDDDLVVFVAPTRAIINQVMFDVNIRLSKTYASESRHLCGAFHPDLRRFVWNSQILLVVPEMFYILMMSTHERAQKLRKRMKYAIFDEVHSICGDNGVIWERLLLSVQCPILALSATIGHPVAFRNWLSKISNVRAGRKKDQIGKDNERENAVKLIIHDDRYSILENFMFFPKDSGDRLVNVFSAQWKDRKPPGKKYVQMDQVSSFMLEHDQSHRFLRYSHPLAFVTREDLTADRFPKDLRMSSKACVDLAAALKDALKFFGESVRDRKVAVEMKRVQDTKEKTMEQWVALLQPDAFFIEAEETEAFCDLFLERGLPKAYEMHLRDFLLQCAKDAELYEFVERVLAMLTTVQSDQQLPPENNGASSASSSSSSSFRRNTELWDELPEMFDDGDLRDNIFPLAAMLYAKKKVPALIFNFDQNKCEELGEILIKTLETLADSFPERLESIRKSNQVKEDEYEKKKKRMDSFRKASDKGVKGADIDEKEARRDAAKDEQHVLEREGLELVLEEETPTFSFVGQRYSTSSQEIEEEIRKVKWRMGVDESNILIRGLRLGIGIHHAGLPLKYRQFVERNFRTQYLSIVIATGTLAMGINMPCKTVVFAGDNVELTPLMFRQMSGRAGRRGYDPYGEVVFFGLQGNRIKSLVTSPIPEISGHQVLSPSVVLRLLSGCKEEKQAEEEEETLSTLKVFTRAARSSHKDEVVRQCNVKYLGFSVDFLHRMGLVDDRLRPMNLLSATAAYLSEAEPSNLVAMYLLQKDLFHQTIKSHAEESNEEIEARLVALLANLFSRRRLSETLRSVHQHRNKPRSTVLLEQPSPAVGKAIAEYNAAVMDRFLLYLLDVAKKYNQYALPLSNLVTFGAVASKQPNGTTGLINGTTDLPEKKDHGYSTGQTPAEAPKPPLSALLGHLDVASAEPIICDPFMRLSGFSDEDLFGMDRDARLVRLIEEMVSPALFRHIGEIPVLAANGDHEQMFNSYVTDFFRFRIEDNLQLARDLHKTFQRENFMSDAILYRDLLEFVNAVGDLATAVLKMACPPEKLEGLQKDLAGEKNKDNKQKNKGWDMRDYYITDPLARRLWTLYLKLSSKFHKYFVESLQG